jgi:hypothetical protein
MKIKVQLSVKSVKNAIQRLEKRKKLLQSEEVWKEFLFGCCEELIRLANANIENYDIGVNVKNDIINSWEYASSFNGNKIVLRNKSEKGVFVEFGVGIVGEQEPHPLAAQEGYEYNVPSNAKDRAALQGFEYGTWIFYKNAKDLDLPSSALDDRIIFNEPSRNSERMLIRTKGTPATMFLFKAVQQFKAQNLAKDIWQRAINKYGRLVWT